MSNLKKVIVLCAVLVMALLVASPGWAQKKPANNGTTLAATKTIDICELTPASPDGLTPAVWQYSGVIAIWNQGAIDTIGLAIDDCIQTKAAGGQYYSIYQVPLANFSPAPHNVVAGTTELTADTFTYFVTGPALDPLYIKNVANITILNHSNNIGTPFGPSPKATWDGGIPQPCVGLIYGCTLTQGYWGDKPDVIWPSPYSRDNAFFLATSISTTTNKGVVSCTPDPSLIPLTWQQVMDTDVSISQGYYQLAHQYIAAALNVASGASVPQGVQDTLDAAKTWLETNAPCACTANGSCGIQKDWAATLDLYNNGSYPGGPPHCEAPSPQSVIVK